MRCKHPNKEIFSRWVDMNGRSINFRAGVGEVKKKYTCLACGKVVRKPKSE
jgi:hypothetical protein